MPPIGKELERPIDSPEAVAVREVESYIEKVEKSTERSIQDSQGSQDHTDDTGVSAVANSAPKNNPVSDIPVKQIVLPLNEPGVILGLKANVYSGIRWLSEWCVMMIKKYPGRVFYSPSNEND